MRTRHPLVALAAGLCLLGTACAGSDDPGAGGSTADDDAARTDGGYPVTLENCGTTLTFEQPPERVVVMDGASVAEVSTLLALGQQDRIVANQQSYGRSEIDGRAEAIDRLPTGGVETNDAHDIPREAMLGLTPDLVLSTTAYGFDATNGFATREDLAKVGADTYISPQGCDQDTSAMTVEDSYTLLTELGAVFGVPDAAEEIVAASRERVATVEAAVEGRDRPAVMVLFSNMSMGANEFSAVAVNGIYDDILASAGGTNVFAGTTAGSFADLSRETVAATDVEALVVISFNDPDAESYAQDLLKEFPQWPAAQNDTYTVLSDSAYLGPDNDEAIQRIARMLHPDAF